MAGRRIRWRLVLFVAALLLVGLVIWAAGSAVLPFALGLAIAYLLAPIVNRIDGLLQGLAGARPRVRPALRPLAILLTYALVVLALLLALRLLAEPLLGEAEEIQANLDGYVAQGRALVDETVARVEEGVARLPDELERELASGVTEVLSWKQLEAYVPRALETLRAYVLSTTRILGSTLGFLFTLIIVPIWLFYILNDTGRFIRSSLGLVPRDLRPDVEALRVIADRILSAYIRGQLVVALTLGVLFTVALMLIGLPYALTLGTIAGALAIVPFVGTILGALPALLVAALQGPGMLLATALVFIGVQQVDNVLVSPRVQGKAVALNPGVIVVVVLVGNAILGPLGLLIAVPLTAMARDLFHYLYLRVGEEPIAPPEAMDIVGYGDQVTPLVRGEMSEESAVPGLRATAGEEGEPADDAQDRP